MVTMTKRYYAPLNLPFTIDFSSELSQYPTRHDFYRGSLHLPLLDLLRQRYLDIRLAEVTRRAAGSGTSLLSSNGLIIDRKVKLVWTYGQGTSSLAWYSVDSSGVTLSTHTDRSLPYHVASTSSIQEKLAESTMSVPMLVDTGTFSRIENVTDSVRYAVSFELVHAGRDSLQWDDAVSILGDLLVLD